MRIADIYDHFLFDLDGCVYLGDQVIPAAPSTIGKLRRLGKGILFLTNAPYSSREAYAAKLRRMGIAAEAGDVLSSSWTLARYLQQQHHLGGKTAFVVGTESFKEEVRAVGLRVVDGEEAKRADFVLVGGHFGFNYWEIVLASFALRSGAQFYATNRDAAFPTPEGLMPGTGAILASLEVASGRTAISVGKPEPPMIQMACSLLGPGRMLMVGDRLDSDVAGGKRAGVATALVLTGVTARDDLDGAEWVPDYVLEDVGGLLDDR